MEYEDPNKKPLTMQETRELFGVEESTSRTRVYVMAHPIFFLLQGRQEPYNSSQEDYQTD
tara:strand:- start:2338 stop:2517 length:180 start_codon:yes stop_codon:yes gene_type:complete